MELWNYVKYVLMCNKCGCWCPTYVHNLNMPGILLFGRN